MTGFASPTTRDLFHILHLFQRSSLDKIGDLMDSVEECREVHPPVAESKQNKRLSFHSIKQSVVAEFGDNKTSDAGWLQIAAFPPHQWMF